MKAHFRIQHWFYAVIAFVFSVNLHAQKRVEYDLFVRDTIVNFSGKQKRAISVNGQQCLHWFLPKAIRQLSAFTTN